MKKNRLNLFKNEPKRPKKVPNWKKIIFQLGNKNFPTGKKYFRN